MEGWAIEWDERDNDMWISDDCREAGPDDDEHYHENCRDELDCACPCHVLGAEGTE